MRRKICLISTTRAEFGHLEGLIQLLHQDKKIIFNFVISGTHLSKKHGYTINEIDKNLIKKKNLINIMSPNSNNDQIGVVASKTLNKFYNYFNRTKPNIIIVLGDRFEIFSVVYAALLNNIPIAHINGGELTLGAIDDSIRHSITKMSYWHFASTNDYKKRIIQLGEDRNNIFDVGALAVNKISKIKTISKERLRKRLKIKFSKKNILITFHSETHKSEMENIKNAKKIVATLKKLKDTTLIFTGSNIDKSSKKINSIFKLFINKKKVNRFYFESLGSLNYLSLLSNVDIVLGNSSSGIIEAPSFKIATINIGDRQEGRVQAKSVINCKINEEQIMKAINIAYSKKFKFNLKNLNNPYHKKNTEKKIYNFIKNCNIPTTTKKKFFDLKK